MDSNAGGWGSVVLPSTAPPIGSVLESGIKQNEHFAEVGLRNQWQKKQYENKLKQQQENQAAQGTSLIHQLPKQFNSDNIDIMKVRDNFLDSHRKELEDFARTHSKAETQAEIDRVITPLSRWFDTANTTYNNSLKDLNRWHSENPNIDYNDAKTLLNHHFSNDFLKDDGTGKVTYNSDARPNDYISKLDEPVALKNMRINADPLIKFTSSLPKEPFETSISQNNKGHIVSHDVSARLTPFSTQPFVGPDGKYKTELQSNIVHGTKQITPQFEDVLSGNKQVMKYLVHGFEKEKERLAANGTPVHPSNEQDLFRSYAWQKMNAIMPHDVRSKSKTVEPKPPTVRVNVNTGGGSGDNFVNAYSEITKRAAESEGRGKQNIPVNELSYPTQQALIDIVHKVHGGKGVDPNTGATIPLDNGDIYLAKENGNLLIRKRTPSPDGKGYEPVNNNRDQLIAPLDKMGLNLSANKSMGAKAKKAVISGSSNGNAPTGVAAPKPKKTKSDRLGLGL